MRKIIILAVCLLLPFVSIAANISSQPYGVNVHLAANEVLDKVAAAGIRWIRVDANWAALEPQNDVYQWEPLDRVVNHADSIGLSILLVLGYTPAWANGNIGIGHPPDNVAHWEDFITVIVNRYKDKVKYWNLWNEPNAADFFARGKDVFVSQIFLPGAIALKAADPEAFVVGPELAHLTSVNHEWYFWMKYILTEAGNHVDIISHHIYKNEGVTHIYKLLTEGDGTIPSVRGILEEVGMDTKPFWITETGWNTNSFTEAEQGENYLEILRKRATEDFPQKIFFYEIMDDPAAGIDPWGILRSDMSEKPAYGIYKGYIAGDYNGGDDNGGGDNGGEDDNQPVCVSNYTEKNTNRTSAAQIMTALRAFRDRLTRLSPAGNQLVMDYYGLGEEYLALALRDARIHQLSSELFYEAGAFIQAYLDNPAAKRIPSAVLSKVRGMLMLLKEKPLSPVFADALNWAESQLDILSVRNLGDYLHRLPAPDFHNHRPE